MVYVLNIVLMLTFCLVYYKHSNTSPVIDYFWSGLLVKVGLTVFVGFYYTSGDTHEFFRYSLTMNGIYELDSFKSYWQMIFYSEFKSDYWKLGTVYWGNPRALFFMKIVSLVNMVTQKDYWLTSMYMSLFSYFGTFYLVKNIAQYYTKFKYTAIAVLLFLPSVVFSSSGIIKESIAFGSICFIIGYAIQVNLEVRKVNLWSTIGVLAGIFFLYKLKYYYLAALLPFIILYFFLNFVKQISVKKRGLVYALGVIILAVFVYSATQLHENLHPDNILVEMSKTQDEGFRFSEPDKVIPYDLSESGTKRILNPGNIGKAIVYGLYGPFIWESTNIAMAYISFENLMLLILTPFFIIGLVRRKIKLTALEWSWAFYVGGLALFLALATPNFGTLTRFKVSYFPFLCILIAGNISFVEHALDDVLHIVLRIRRLKKSKRERKKEERIRQEEQAAAGQVDRST